jgi:hypothetical protein
MADLIDLTDLKLALGLEGTTGSDTYLTALIARVSDTINRYCGMVDDKHAVIAWDNTTALTRILDGFGDYALVLPHKNVKQVNSLHEDVEHVFGATTEIAAADRFLDGPPGIVYKAGVVAFVEYPQAVKVVYVLNWSGVPDVVKQAAIIQCGYDWNVRKNQGVESKSLPDGSVVFSHATGLVKTAKELLTTVVNPSGVFR